MQIRVLSDDVAAANWAAGAVVRRVAAAVRLRGRAGIAVSGGITPALMFRSLATATLVPWDLVDVFQVDERVAPDGDPDRNRPLLDLLPRRARVRAMPVTSSDLRAAGRRYATRLPERLDVVHLGLGGDGHTASWPPGDPVIDSQRAVDLSRVYQGRARMTLTPGPVNAARCRIVLATGAGKAEAVDRWLGARPDRNMPIARVHRRGTIVVLDAAAAAGLR